MDERVKFISACLEGLESVSALCRHYGISRKTGHKWLLRYRGEGAVGLEDLSRAPHSNPAWLADDVVSSVIAVRDRYPNWGPRKVKAWLEHHEPGRCWPAASTIGGLYDRVGLTRRRRVRRRAPPQSAPLAAATAANEVWCIDFKGWFLTGDGTHVEPLTLSDAYSRYLLRCLPLGRNATEEVWPVLEQAFKDHGLPRTLRSDNGPPFAGLAVGGLSRLAVLVIKAGVRPERIAPGKPQQNGRHERLHLTLKQDTASPPARSLAEQLERFQAFCRIYNEERPHEALGQETPASHWRPSPRQWDGRLRSPDYDGDTRVRRVRHNGTIKWQGEHLFISETLKGEPVGLSLVGEDTWLVRYGPIPLGTLKGREGFIRRGAGRSSRPTAKKNETENL